MRNHRFYPCAAVIASLLLQACSSTPVEPKALESSAVELNLNLPSEECQCPELEPRDVTVLEQGFTALAAGKYVEAVQHFQRHERLAKTPEAKLEAGIAISYVSILLASPFYDTEAARKTYRQYRKNPLKTMGLHEQTLLMSQSLETFLLMERKILELDKDNANLTKSLEKREEALKRLRELTLDR